MHPQSLRLFVLGLLLGPFACGGGSSSDLPLALPDLGVEELLPPRAELDGRPVAFGTVFIGGSQARQLVVRNAGDLPLILEVRLSPNGANAGFAAQPTLTVGPQGMGTLEVSFTPMAVGEVRSELLIVTNTALDGGLSVPIAIPLSGSGARPTLSIEPTRVDFGNVLANTQGVVTASVTNPSNIEVPVELVPQTNFGICGATNAEQFCVSPRQGQLDSNNRFRVQAGSTRVLRLRFLPTVAGTRSTGRFNLRWCASPAECEAEIVATGFGIEGGIRCNASVDFGAVPPGASQTRSVVCENIASTEATIVGWQMAPGSNAAFSTGSSERRTLAPGARTTIDVSFRPTARGQATGNLRIETDSPNQATRTIDIPIVGSGGGPNIEVEPSQLDFGQVALIAPARRSLVITNTGFDPLSVSDIQVDIDGTGFFTSPDARADVLAPGERRLITIQFQPRATGSVSSRIRILSNDGSSPSLDIAVQGTGVNVPPCQFTVRPSSVNFALVQSTRSNRQAVEIVNTGTDRCLLSAVRAVPGSGPEFTLVTPLAVSREIAANSALTLTFEFSPVRLGTATGRYEFSISNPRSPFNLINLQGTATSEGPLIAPDFFDFGTLGVSCAARSRVSSIYNTSPIPLRIDSVELARSTATPFQLVRRPSPLPGGPLTLPPGRSAEIEVGFRTTAAGSSANAIIVQGLFSGIPVNYSIGLEGRASATAPQVDEFVQLGTRKADVLFVVDRTPSMAEELLGIGRGFNSLITFASTQRIDYHIGITTTDIDDEAGRLVSAFPGSTGQSGTGGPPGNRVITSRTPSPGAAFLANLSMTLRGGTAADESGLEAAMLALSPRLLNAHNQGFYRSDASLNVVFVSTEADQSISSVDYYLSSFLSVKGFARPNDISLSAIAAPTPPGTCTGPGGMAGAIGRYSAVVDRSGGAFETICTSDWNQTLSRVAPTLFGLRSRFHLSNQPVISTLGVLVDGVALPQRAGGTVNWSYDFATNTIGFAPARIPAPGARIQVEYRAECL